MSRSAFKHQFVECMPNQLEDNIVYVSIEYATAIHKCACGCGNEVVTPISPTDWKLTYDGNSISLHPSIGNWSFRCRSHYWIIRNEIIWSEMWSKKDIKKTRKNDKHQKQRFFQDMGNHDVLLAPDSGSPPRDEPRSIWEKLSELFKKAF